MTRVRLVSLAGACALVIIGMQIVGAVQAPSAVSGLVAYWPLDGTTTDVVGAHNGTLVGGATFVPGIASEALDINGSAYVTVPDSPSLSPTSALTVTAWIKPNIAQVGFPTIVKKNGPSDAAGYALELFGDGTPNGTKASFYVYILGGFWAGTGDVPVPIGQWTHLAGTYNGSSLRLYVNGVLAASTPVTGTVRPSTGPLHIGHDPVLNRYFRGSIDDVGIFDEALPITQIQALHSAGSIGATFDPSGPPHLIVPANISVLAEPTSKIVFFNASAWDVLDGPIAASCSPASGSAFPVGTTLITCTTTNSRNVSAAGSFDVTVVQRTSNVTGLIAHWQFDEMSGTRALDSSGNGHDGTIVGATYTTDGADVPGNASGLRFDGHGYVTIPDSPSLNFSQNNPFSISFWARAAPDGTGHILVAKTPCTSGGYDYAIKLFFEGTSSFPAGGNEGSSGAVLIWEHDGQQHVGAAKDLPLGRLTHFAMTYDGAGTARMYFDGLLAATQSGAFLGGHDAPGVNLVLGNNPCGDGLDAFRGVLDDVRLYDRALSASDVAGLNDARGLEVGDSIATYSGAVTLAATLFSGAEVVPDRTVTFSLRGIFVGTAITDADGRASLSGVSVTGFDVGEHPTAISASVAGDGQVAADSSTGRLTIVATPSVVTWNLPTLQWGATLDPSMLSATANVAGTFDYSGIPNIGEPLLPWQEFCVVFTPANSNFLPSSKCISAPIDTRPPVRIGTLGNLGSVASGRNAGATDIDIPRNILYVVSDSSLPGAFVIDGQTNSVIESVTLSRNGVPATARGVGVDSGADRLYLTAEDQNALWAFRSSTRELIEIIDLPANAAGGHITVNPTTGVLYLTKRSDDDPDAGVLTVVNARLPPGSQGRIAQPEVSAQEWVGSWGTGAPRVAVNPNTNLVYVCCGPSLPVLDGDPTHSTFNAVLATLPISVGRILVNPRTNVLYVLQSARLWWTDRTDVPDQLTEMLILGADPERAEFHQIIRTVAVGPTPYTTTGGNFFYALIRDIPVLNPVTNRIYLRLDLGNSDLNEYLFVLDASTLANLSDVSQQGVPKTDLAMANDERAMGAAPFLAINSATNRIYVAGQVYRDAPVEVAQIPASAQPVLASSPQATVLFSSVLTGGLTTIAPVSVADINLQAPGGFSLSGAAAYEITTSATIAGPMTPCFNASYINDEPTFSSLVVLHGENGVLVDRTSSRDFPTRTICATVNSLSPFVIARRSTTADTTPPVVSCDQPNSGWSAIDVAVWCTAFDTGSGLANAGDSSFPLMTAVPAGVETANATTTSRTVCDGAGNCALVGPVTGLRVDKRAPTITMTAPAQANYLLHQNVPANYACADAGSGVYSCAGPVANGSSIDSNTPGSHTFAVTAIDAAGNTTTSNQTYTVAYNQCVLFDATKSYQSGSTVPIKLQLCDATGANVSDAAVPLVATSVYLVSTSASGPLAYSGNANPDNEFRFAGGNYVFNLSLKGFAHGTYALTYRAGTDPTIHVVQFQVK